MKTEHNEDPAGQPNTRQRTRLGIALGTLTVIGCGLFLMNRANSHVNRIALDGTPKGVTVINAITTRFRTHRRYVGTIQPWIESRVGPQMISAYVDTVLVRPGDQVKRGQVLATLDCRNASASSKAIAMQARAIQTEQGALAHEAARIEELKEGGFASPNEIEKHIAESASKGAQLMETQAKMQRATLEVSDCVLHAPFAGEVAERLVDPGAFVHPGMAIAVLIDRNMVRITGDVPESDFEVVGAGTPVRIHALANNRSLQGSISRRSPAADNSTRTVHFEIDVPDADRSLPVGTTADLSIDVGQGRPATKIPLASASVRGTKATLFVVEGDQAHRRTYDVLGESGGDVFVEAALKEGSQVVTEGRAALRDKDHVQASLEPPAVKSAASEVSIAGSVL